MGRDERQGAAPRARRRLRFVFVAGVYLFAVGYGMHEPADYLNARFCDEGEVDRALCAIVRDQDDELSHFLFFAGFAGIDAVVLLAEAAGAAHLAELARWDYALIAANGALVAAAIVANLGFEEIGLDLVVVAAVAALALVLWRRHGPPPADGLRRRRLRRRAHVDRARPGGLDLLPADMLNGWAAGG